MLYALFFSFQCKGLENRRLTGLYCHKRMHIPETSIFRVCSGERPRRGKSYCCSCTHFYTEEGNKLKCSLLLMFDISVSISPGTLLPPLCSLQASLAKGKFSRGLSAVDNFDLNHFMSRDYTVSQCQLESTHTSVGE